MEGLLRQPRWFIVEASTSSPGKTISILLLCPDIEVGGIGEQVLAGSPRHRVHETTERLDLIDESRLSESDCVVVAVDEVTAEVLRDTPQLVEPEAGPPVVVLCRAATGQQVRRALEMGITGVVLSDEADRALAPVIDSVLAGQASAPREHAQRIRPGVLTNRERQVLALVVMGLSNGEIAGQLYLAESTVKSHLSSAFAKLGVTSRNEATKLILDPTQGQDLGILKIPSEPVPLTR